MKSIGIIIPTHFEASLALQRLGLQSFGGKNYQGQVNGRLVLLTVSGVGMENARLAAHRLCDQGVEMLVSAGFCGALMPELRVGHLVTDRLATSRLMVRTPGERETLTMQAGAVAVDMETQAIIEAGTRRGVPIRIVRVVSDTYHDDLSPLLGSKGDFSYLKIVLKLINPALWPLARRLHQNSSIAKTRLVDALKNFLQNPR